MTDHASIANETATMYAVETPQSWGEGTGFYLTAAEVLARLQELADHFRRPDGVLPEFAVVFAFEVPKLAARLWDTTHADLDALPNHLDAWGWMEREVWAGYDRCTPTPEQADALAAIARNWPEDADPSNDATFGRCAPRVPTDEADRLQALASQLEDAPADDCPTYAIAAELRAVADRLS